MQFCSYAHRLIGAALVFGSVILGSGSASSTELVVFENTNAPFASDKDGTAVGIYPAIVSELFKRVGAPVEIRAVPWKRALAMGIDGEAGIGGIYKSEERLAKYDYTDPIYVESIDIYVPAGKAFPYKGVESLKGKTVGIQAGWSLGDGFDKARAAGEFKVEEVPAAEQNFAKLAAGRLDAVFPTHEAAMTIVAADASLKGKVEALPTPHSRNAAHIAFGKGANKGDLIKKINAAIVAARADGTLDRVVAESLR